MAFVLAALVAVCTIGLSFLIVLANGMSDNPSESFSTVPVLVTGFVLAAVIAASHWVHIGW